MYFNALVNNEKCSGCKICILLCPEPNTIVFLTDQRKVAVRAERCKACKICVTHCPKGAIVLEEK